MFIKNFRCFLISALAAVLLFTFVSCSNQDHKPKAANAERVAAAKDDETEAVDTKDDTVTIGKYTAVYKGSEKVKDSNGNDAVIIRFDYTNNSDEQESFAWSLFYDITQNNTALEPAIVWVSDNSFDTVDSGEYDEVPPGRSIEVVMTYKLTDTVSPIEMSFHDLLGEETDELTIELK